MDAHIWPSLYPAIVVGLFVSFSSGPLSVLRSGLGACAGLLGGAIAYYALAAFEFNAGPIATVIMLTTSAIAAWGILNVLDRVARSKSIKK